MRILQIVILTILIAILPYGAFAQTTASPFRAGAAKVDITPTQLPKNSEGVLDHIYARAIVIDNGTTRAALVSADVGMLGEQVWRNLSQRIEKELGIPAQNLIMNPTHTHSASGGTAEQIFNVVKAAKDKLQPARIGYGTGVSYINVNRNIIDRKTNKWWEGPNYDGPSDKTVAVIRFETTNGEPIAVYFNYACHAVVTGNTDMLSGDYPGATSRYIEDSFDDKIVALFSAKGYYSYALMVAVLTCAILLSRISLKTIFRSIRPLLIIIIFTFILNMLFTGGTPIFKVWIITVTYEGLRVAATMIIRLVMLILGTFLLTYTTSPIALTDGIESLMKPLNKIRVPVHELAMMMSIALRFIPTLIEETDKIISAQKARGADFESGNLFKRAKAMLPILVPLFISAFRRADELAVAMESRCYHGGEGRTRMKQLRMAPRDAAALVLGAAVLAGVIVLQAFGM
jgi:energy-coupling factor transport system permease protein